jgi:intein-encoded DNA endonuclease-like protein
MGRASATSNEPADFNGSGRSCPFQSKLEPHLDFIREGRRKRWSYRRIAQAIGAQFGMKVSPNAVFSFVKVRSKPLRMYGRFPCPCRPSIKMLGAASLALSGLHQQA